MLTTTAIAAAVNTMPDTATIPFMLHLPMLTARFCAPSYCVAPLVGLHAVYSMRRRRTPAGGAKWRLAKQAISVLARWRDSWLHHPGLAKKLFDPWVKVIRAFVPEVAAAIDDHKIDLGVHECITSGFCHWQA